MGPVSATEELRQRMAEGRLLEMARHYDVWYTPDADEAHFTCEDCGAETSECECTLPSGCVDCGEPVDFDYPDGLCTRCAVATGLA